LNTKKEENQMEKNINRRRFLQIGSAFTSSAILFPLANYASGATRGSITRNSIPVVKLNNGLQMPMLGFGTNTLTVDIGERCVYDAISVGYRLIDTATVYGNEESVGVGIKKSGVRREELFITSKLWVDDSGYENSKKAFQTSLDKLGLGYLDLYLYHRPRGDVKGSWKAMEELYGQGKIKAIGVSNFEPGQIAELMTYAKVKPAINQIETHPFFQEGILYEDMKNRAVQMEAWSPFAAGRNGIFTNETLSAIGKKYNKSIAQVVLRWHFQRGIVAIPRSSQKAHMIENLNIFDFELSSSDIQNITRLDLNKTQFPEWS
jgi:2,5-diketo-D-gluconate reductase A